MSDAFLKIYHEILNKTGKIYFKTDNQHLFNQVVETVKQSKLFMITEKTEDLHAGISEWKNYQTEFEKKYIAQGMKIFLMVLSRIDRK